jgi:hypothetical protein
MADSWHVEDELERLEDGPRSGRLDLEKLLIGDRVTVDLAVAGCGVVPDEERVGDRTLADDAPPDQRLRL